MNYYNNINADFKVNISNKELFGHVKRVYTFRMKLAMLSVQRIVDYSLEFFL